MTKIDSDGSEVELLKTGDLSTTYVAQIGSFLLKGDKKFLCEYGRPRRYPGMGDEQYNQRYLEVREENVAGCIDNLRMEETDGVAVITGRFKTLDTPYGAAVRKMIEEDTPLSIRPRLFMRANPSGPGTIIELATWDIVNPD